MPEMALIKWLFLLVMIAETEGLIPFRTEDDYSAGEEIMKTILESCYSENTAPNAVVTLAAFNKFVDGVSIARASALWGKIRFPIKHIERFKGSSIVLREAPPGEFLSYMQIMSRDLSLWNGLIPFFIIGKTGSSCTMAKNIFQVLWKLDVLTVIYICPNTVKNQSGLYTSNPITDYAPYPWKKIDKVDNLTIFRQKFDANISCTHLTFDKTQILDGYNIKVSGRSMWPEYDLHGVKFGWIYDRRIPAHELAMIHTILKLNASWTIKLEGLDSVEESISGGSVDLTMEPFTLDSIAEYPHLFPLYSTELIAMVKLGVEVSTLDKIQQLWSTHVLMVAGFAVALLFLILMIKTWSFGSALLDVTRLLIYTSIRTDHRHHSFRIYFTTMLIFMVISNGVFQGKIAAFLTTREKIKAPESIHELVELGYEIYTVPGSLIFAKQGCPECQFKIVKYHDYCYKKAVSGTKYACVIPKNIFESVYIDSPVDRTREPINPKLINFKCRWGWPLRNRFSAMIMRIVEAGLPDFWQMRVSSVPKAKRQSIEAEWSSPQYRPVALTKLDFIFKFWAVGLSLATMVFFFELFWARCVSPLRLFEKIHRKSAN